MRLLKASQGYEVKPETCHQTSLQTCRFGWMHRTDAFELWCWRRLLRDPWTARRSNQSVLKISPGCSLEGLMLKLKLQYFGHLMWRVDSLEKTLMLGGIGGRRRRGGQRMRWLDGITNQWTCVEWTLGVGDGQGGLRAAIHGVPKSCTWLSNWNELKIFFWIYHSLSEFGKPKAAKFNFSTFLSEPIDYKASALQSKMEHGFISFKAD